jgi:hypothetical protein
VNSVQTPKAKHRKLATGCPRINGVSIYVGSPLLALDKTHGWFPAKIAAIKWEKQKIVVHFNGWHKRFDFSVPFESDKFKSAPVELLASGASTVVAPPPSAKVGGSGAKGTGKGKGRAAAAAEPELFECEHDCGFENADVVVVEVHEAVCTNNTGPATEAAEVVPAEIIVAVTAAAEAVGVTVLPGTIAAVGESEDEDE